MESNQQESFFSGLAGISKLFIFILILVVITGLFIVLTDSEEPIVEETETETDENTNLSSEDETETESVTSESLVVSSQEPGNSVYISEITIPESRWIVIHEDLEGELGSILGARLFNTQETEGGVELIKKTEKGKTYQAVFYSEGEREKEIGRIFNTDIDFPLVDEDGEVISVFFEVY